MTIKNSLKKLCKDLTGVESKGSTIREVIDDIETNGTSIYKIDCAVNDNVFTLSEGSIIKLNEIQTKFEAGKNVVVILNYTEYGDMYSCIMTKLDKYSMKAELISKDNNVARMTTITITNNENVWSVVRENFKVTLDTSADK